MEPRHSRGPIGPCLAFVAFSLTATLSCSLPNRSPDAAGFPTGRPASRAAAAPGGNDAPTAQPDSGTSDERAGFEKFQDAFADLLGRHAPLPQADPNSKP